MNKKTQKELLDIVKQNYEEIADQFSETRKKHLWPELIELTKNIKEGSSILDVGCGNGRLSKRCKIKRSITWELIIVRSWLNWQNRNIQIENSLQAIF